MSTPLRFSIAFCALSLICTLSRAQDLSDPRNLVFVADANVPQIAVLDVKSDEVVYRIATRTPVDRVLVTPDAPLLIYSNIEAQTVTFFNLDTKTEVKILSLPMAPRHMVMDPTGRRIAMTDSRAGGFVLLSAFGMSIDFALTDFPATDDVLFDANDVDIYFSDTATGSVGVLDINVQRVYDLGVLDQSGDSLSSPSRSLDGRYVYVANESNGLVYGFNAFSKAIYKTFSAGERPARPYTSPEGLFLYVTSKADGLLRIYDQARFDLWAELPIPNIDIVAVGRFDRFSAVMSSEHRHYAIIDNLAKRIVADGEFPGVPIDAQGSADGERVYIAFRDYPQLVVVHLERRHTSYVEATAAGAADFVLGMSNNVCH